ncbi:histone deacetylase family protein [Calothrix sp. NIES-3974]|uniref:histone deacetylase family protein n=1 Tax=Calothrix sp. NIES-3974 TaxID=2005462 RepID=UPI000B60E5A0|nr:histone deacetylase [Calothrix sp. NIES-3974]BAZ05676.1 histone deacetylase superfamily protein [Calothrix sp. NIES-3974]
MVAIIYSDEFLHHQTGVYHPETPQRLSAITAALHTADFANQLTWYSPTPVDQRAIIPLLTQVHTPEYITKVREIAETGGGYIDNETPVSPQSYDVALLAISAWLDGVDLVIQTNKPAFVLARPPGHHAEPETGMGFCLFANAAIAALYALEKPEINRVAILDWDVHHGNGTQKIVETNPHIVYCSLHQYPCYPGTGRHTEKGLYNNVLNIPLPPGSSTRSYETAFTKLVIPFLQDFQPDLLIISAGYDANADDPLANINLQPEDYGLFTQYCLQITPRILLGLEGGYDLHSLSQSVVETVAAILKV